MTARRLLCLSVAAVALFAVGFTSSTAQAGWEPNFWRWTGLWWSDGYLRFRRTFWDAEPPARCRACQKLG